MAASDKEYIRHCIPIAQIFVFRGMKNSEDKLREDLGRSVRVEYVKRCFHVRRTEAAEKTEDNLIAWGSIAMRI
jgi:hypothetical protein